MKSKTKEVKFKSITSAESFALKSGGTVVSEGKKISVVLVRSRARLKTYKKLHPKPRSPAHSKMPIENNSSQNERPFFSPSGDEWTDYAWSGNDF